MYSDLKNKKVFILGGSGLIGSEIIINLYKLKCKIVNLDLNKNISINHMCSFQKFNCEDKNIQKNYFKITKKFGLPDAFINCSYPKTKDWIKNSFKNIKLSSLEKNINSNIVNSAILIKEVAELQSIVSGETNLDQSNLPEKDDLICLSVQVFSSSKKLKEKDMKDFDDPFYLADNNMYKYFSGCFTDLKAVNKHQKELVNKE